jgi:hypothetical protein
MIVHTCFNNMSQHGYKSSILKSGICKYTRRNEKEKMRWCVIEMALFNRHPKGQGLVTNLINRLKILVMEELSFHETAITYYLISLLNLYDKNRSEYRYLYSFCDLVFECKRNRYVSYQNCCWRYKSYKPLNLPLNKVSKYKVEGDTDEILEIGETLIHYIETKDEKMFSCLKALIDSGDGGKRFRRKEASYLWFQIIKDYMKNSTEEYIFEFALSQYHKKNMTERKAFAIWIGLIVWKQDILTTPYEEIPIIVACEDEVLSYIQNMSKLEIDDYVIEDYHVNSSKYSLSKFAEEGAYVVDEYLEFDEHGVNKKEFYVKIKHSLSNRKSSKRKSSKRKSPKHTSPEDTSSKQEPLSEEEIEFIDWDKFTDVKILEDGVCGGKVCCISVTYEGKPYILKEMKVSMNHGRDYMLIDKSKELFELRDMNMRRIKSNKGQLKIDPKKKSFVGNVCIGGKEAIYCMMDYWDNIGDLGKHKHVMEDINVKKEALKIRLFDGLFRSSDNILRNILVNKNNELLSIDEGDIFGKRVRIFNKNDWFTKKENYSEELVKEVVKDIVSNSEYKLGKIKLLFERYKFTNYSDFEERFMKYEDIVLSEFK